MKRKLWIFEMLKRLRQGKGWTQAQCAEQLGIKPRTLRSWEQGRRKPRPIVLAVISRFIASNQ